jgi:hypothetical protein
MKLAVLFFILLFCAFAGAIAYDRYLFHLNEYVMRLSHVSSAKKCQQKTFSFWESKKQRSNYFNGVTNIPLILIPFIGQAPPSIFDYLAKEKAIQFCKINTGDIYEIAHFYEIGSAYIPQYKKIAIALYWHLYWSRNRHDVATRLKLLGENVVTDADLDSFEPVTKEKLQEMRKKIENSQKLIKDNEEFLIKHTLPFPFSDK